MPLDPVALRRAEEEDAARRAELSTESGDSEPTEPHRIVPLRTREASIARRRLIRGGGPDPSAPWMLELSRLRGDRERNAAEHLEIDERSYAAIREAQRQGASLATIAAELGFSAKQGAAAIVERVERRHRVAGAKRAKEKIRSQRV